MINLNVYDNAIEQEKTWIDPQYKRLYSYEIEYKPFYTILTRYNPIDKQTYYYIVMLNDVLPDRVCKSVMRTKSGACKINLSDIWNKLKIVGNEQFNISISKEDEDSDSIIYKLDI